MQINANKCFSGNFVALFKEALIKTYDYHSYMDFLIVPSLTFSKTLSYLPLLSYTDKQSHNIKELLSLCKESDFLIKTLNFSYNNFKKNDPVTMRLLINKEKDIIDHYKSRTRGYVRKSLKNPYRLEMGVKHLDNFYNILKQTYKRHGTPLLPKDLFINLYKIFQKDFYLFVLYKDDIPAATMLILQDERISWYGWGGVEESFTKDLAGYAIYHKVIKYMTKECNTEIFDFGRSPYKGGTYQFKSNFGAKPIKIDIIKPKESNIYETYKLASKIYRKLPLFITDIIGPKLTKYLADL